MAIVGGFLGGGVEMVPAGQGQLCMQWLTPDRLNIEGAVFKGQGPNGESFTIEGGADGRADKLVSAGRWTVSVEHEGSYDNDGPQIVDVESAQSYLVYFGGSRVIGAIVFSQLFHGATLTVKNLVNNAIVYTGDFVPMELNVGLGSFELTTVQFGKTVVDTIQVAGSTPYEIDAISLTLPESLMTSTTGVFIGDVRAQGSVLSFMKDIGNLSLVANTTMKWDSETYIGINSTVSIGSSDISLEDMTYSDPYVISSTSDYEFLQPGNYEIYVCGGGGGGGGGSAGISERSGGGGSGGNGGAGGNGGEIVTVSAQISEDNMQIHIEIGSGGAGGSSNNPSSMYASNAASAGKSGGSTVVSGAISVSAAGGSGGAGGAAAVVKTPSGSTHYAVAGNGGNGGKGANRKTFSLRGLTYQGGNGGRGRTGGYVTVSSQESTTQHAALPGTLLKIPAPYANTGDGGSGGKSGYTTYRTDMGLNGYQLGGGHEGIGGKGLSYNTHYGKGGDGGDGGTNFSSVSDKNNPGNGESGSAGVVIMEMRL